MKYKLFALLTVTLFASFSTQLSTLRAQGTAFTYQGRLNDAGNPAKGSYDLTFALFTVSSGPGQIGTTITSLNTAVSNGLFTVTLDFGNQFPGAARWLEIGVRTNGGGAYSTLSPRQALTASPYALYAPNAGTAASASSVSGANITGTIPLAQLPANVVTDGASGVNLTGTFTGSGAGLTGINLLYANSYGAFQLVTNYDGGNFALIDSPAVDGPQSVVAVDVNGDGRVDLISGNAGANTLSVLTNNGSGSFTLASTPGVGVFPISVTTADVNGDGRPDLISANANSLSVLTNNGNGEFFPASTPGVSQPFNVKAADVNGDGKVDLVAVNATANTLSVLTNNGTGIFTLAFTPATGNSPRGLAIADVNGDGKLDLINGGISVSALSVLTNHGNGNFTLASSPAVGPWPLAVAAADLNGDGKVDLISANLLAGLTVLTNNGTGSFALASSLNLGTGPRDVTAADVNGDGKMDLISANQDADTLSVLTNNGTGTFTLVSSPVVGDTPQAVIAADVNGDGAKDLISANALGHTLSVLLNSPSFNSAILSGKFLGNGAGVTDVNAASLNGISSAGFWKAGGNAGTTPGTDFLGTTDNQPLDFRVNNQRGLRLEYGNNGSEQAVNFIGGSSGNLVSNGVVGATISGGGEVGGQINRVLASFGTVGGGSGNTASGRHATVSGGYINTAGGPYATVGGGYGNSAINNQYGTVGGGTQNTASGLGATVGGGRTNIAGDAWATVGGGLSNNAYWNGTVGGGIQNTASGLGATVAGGGQNYAVGTWATIGGGQFNSTFGNFTTVSGGSLNHAYGDYATVAGGRENTASQDAFAAGRRAKAVHTGSFVWADSTDADFASTAANQFLVRAAGGVGIGTSTPQGSLHVYSANNPTVVRIQSTGTPGAARLEFVSNPQGDLNEWRPGFIESTDNGGFTGGLSFNVNGTGAGNKFATVEVMRIVNGRVGIGTNNPQSALQVVGTVTATAFNPPSDRNLKENFAPVSPREVLEKVTGLPITRWNFKGDTSTPHVGPMAQDFHAAFQLGTDERHIATVDADGVALAAIQGLNQKVEEKEARIKELEQRLEKLEQMMTGQQNSAN